MSQPSNNGENQFQATQERKAWDVFNDPPVKTLSGSLQDTKYIDFITKLCKILAYIITFLVVLGSSSISKGTLLFITSQVGSNVTRPFCNELLDRNKLFEVTLPNIERVAWIWVLIFIYFVSELLTCIRSILVCIFKTWTYPTLLECFSLFATESFPAIGSALLVFSILPELDVIKGVMLTNAVCFVPAVMGTISRTPHEKNSITKISLDVASILAQLSAFLVWPMIENQLVLWLIPVSVCMISIGWWENFVSEGASLKVLKQLAKRKKKLENSRYFLYIFVPIWKSVLFFITTIIIIWLKEGSVDFMFDYFEESFQSHTINITEIKPIIGEQEDYGPVFNNTNNTLILADNLTPVWVFLINIFSSYICYIFAKFACKILIQEFSFAFPLNLTVPTTVAILIAISGVYNGNPCAFYPTIPSYLFFKIPPLYFLEQFIATEHVWVWIFWLLSQTWVTIYVWSPKSERLAKTERLFIKPMYDSFLVDQSLLLIRRRDENSEKIEDDLDDNTDIGEFEIKPIKSNTPNDPECYTTQIYICGTMWHETKEEMLEFLKSIFRLDYDQAIRQIVKNKIQPDFQDYYKLESHIFFDDAFIRKSENDPNPKVNDYVKHLVAAVEKAAMEVHECEVKIRPPTKYTTPYGGRLVWKLPGQTLLCAHLKDSKVVRQKKRWSQVLYMFYLLGHRLMENEKLSSRQKDIVAENTFLLALDGDIDFQPKDVHLLVDLMKRNKELGAACGRLHPIGSGPLVWYQMFEYAIGHWLQKATEHVIGCVLCSPGCFSLFRAKALMEDGVMQRYASKATQARHFVQYDLGEDRWLCTLLLQNGYRIEYSAASDAYTHCPEGFNEFYNQRRRWMPSTTANIMDLLFNYKRAIKVNDNLSRLYILYQIVLLIGSVLGPGTIFLMLVGAFVAVFQMDQWTSFLWNAVPILIFMAVCILFEKKDKVQLLFAGVISAVYGLVMMAVLIGVLLQISADGVLAPSSLFFFCFAGELILTALLHPKELNCLLYGLVYYVTVPSMYMLLVIFAVFNLNNISWGTRELTLLPKTDEENNKTEKQKPKKKGMNLFSGDKEDNSGSFEFSIAGLFKCFFCTHSKKSEDQEKLSEISANLLEMAKKLSAIEKAVDFSNQSITRPTLSLEKPTLLEGSKGIPPRTENTSNKQSSEIIYDDELPWYDQTELGLGEYEFIKPNERAFFQGLITKYLYRIEENDKQIGRDLKDLRDKTVMAFFMINSLFVLVVFLLTLKKDLLHVNWPLDAKYNFTYNSDRREISLDRTPLELEPIGFVFLIFFASLLVVQFIAMLFHRFSTFSQILANTYINARPWLKWKKEFLSEDQMLKNDPVKAISQFVMLKGANDDNEDEKRETKVGRRKTVKFLAEQHNKAKAQPINDIYEAFQARTTKYIKSNSPHNAARKSMAVAINRRTTIVEKRTSQAQIEGYVNQDYENKGYDNESYENDRGFPGF